jgi:hypothetical protein
MTLSDLVQKMMIVNDLIARQQRIQFDQCKHDAGPEAVLAYLARYTHRIAIANSRLVGLDEHVVTLRWKDYRAKGLTKYKTMTLAAHAMSSCVASYCRCGRPASTASPLRPARQCGASG